RLGPHPDAVRPRVGLQGKLDKSSAVPPVCAHHSHRQQVVAVPPDEEPLLDGQVFGVSFNAGDADGLEARTRPFRNLAAHQGHVRSSFPGCKQKYTRIESGPQGQHEKIGCCFSRPLGASENAAWASRQRCRAQNSGTTCPSLRPARIFHTSSFTPWLIMRTLPSAIPTRSPPPVV